MTWADDDVPDGSEGDPSLPELVREWTRQYRQVVAVFVFVLALTGMALLTAMGSLEGYRAAHGKTVANCLAHPGEHFPARYQREVACQVLRRVQ